MENLEYDIKEGRPYPNDNKESYLWQRNDEIMPFFFF